MRTEARPGAPRRRIGLGLLAGSLVVGCDIGPEIERPAPLFATSPVEYPIDMWDQGVEGIAVVRVLVNEEGGVDSVTVAESSGYAALDSAATKGARAMQFAPALRAGEPLRVWARVPVHFVKDAAPEDETESNGTATNQGGSG